MFDFDVLVKACVEHVDVPTENFVQQMQPTVLTVLNEMRMTVQGVDTPFVALVCGAPVLDEMLRNPGVIPAVDMAPEPEVKPNGYVARLLGMYVLCEAFVPNRVQQLIANRAVYAVGIDHDGVPRKVVKAIM